MSDKRLGGSTGRTYVQDSDEGGDDLTDEGPEVTADVDVEGEDELHVGLDDDGDIGTDASGAIVAVYEDASASGTRGEDTRGHERPLTEKGDLDVDLDLQLEKEVQEGLSVAACRQNRRVSTRLSRRLKPLTAEKRVATTHRPSCRFLHGGEDRRR